MPFKSDKQRRLFGACNDPKFRRRRARQGKPCPSKKAIKEMFSKDRRARGGSRGRKKK